ncbi:MAG: ABC transporter substrate binding protein [Gammaproteobacteria bacterium]|nr:ABC transporter substrate binding protein [Gammaproteobacteria bacterium]
MKSTDTKLFIFIIMIFIHVFFNSALADEKKRIFILHSYEIDHVCGRPQSMGVQRALLKSGFGADDLLLKSYAMDTKKTNNTPDLIARQAEIALQKIQEFNPHVLITLDDNAFRAVALELVDSDIQIVFSGMNNIPERYNETVQWLDDIKLPGHNITGVYEKIHFSTAVKVQKSIQPEMKKIRIFSDNSPTGKALIRQVKLEIEQTPIPAIPDFFITDSWEEYQQKVLETNYSDVDTLYPIALRLIDKNGQTYTGSKILTWTSQNSIKPSIPLNFAFVKLGLLGGAGVDFEAMGYQAGVIVAKILSGQDAANIPVEDAQRHALVFNITRAKALGIEIPTDILFAADEVFK